MHGAASGLIEAFQTYYAGPGSGVANASSWAEIPAPPAGFFKYGSGGINTLGTLCGVPNGACAVLGLVNKVAAANDVIQRYATTLYPTDDLDGYTGFDGTTPAVTPPNPIDDDDVLAHTVSNSPICHASISKWCYAAGVNLAMADAQSRNYKNDRCGKVCADICAYTARLINGSVANGSSYTSDSTYQAIVPGNYVLPEVTQDCIGCHHKKADAPTTPAQITEMQCDVCHGDYLHQPHHGAELTIMDAWVSKTNNQIKSGYYPGQSVRYHVIFGVNNRGSSFVRTVNTKAKGPTSTGTWSDKLPAKKETFSSGPSYEFKWDRTIDANAVVGSKGTLVIRLTAADYQGGPVMCQAERIVKFNIVNPY
jgi:hypothetical protein